jgi:hypothetical protein
MEDIDKKIKRTARNLMLATLFFGLLTIANIIMFSVSKASAGVDGWTRDDIHEVLRLLERIADK